MADKRGKTIHLEENDQLKQLPLNSEELKRLFASSADVIIRTLQVSGCAALRVTLAHLDGLCDKKIIDDNIIKPLSHSDTFAKCTTLPEVYRHALLGALPVSGIAAAPDMSEAVSALLMGKALLIFDKMQSALVMDTVGYDKRGIESASEESSYRTSKESFNETLRTNTAILRRRIQSSSFVLEEATVGRQSNTRVCIAYMRNICNDAIIRQVSGRIKAMNQDSITSTQDIVISVAQQKYALFPQAITTEKPEICTKHLLDGKIAVIVDGLPYAMVFPAVFGDSFITSGDYSGHYIITSFFRLLRYTCFLLSIAMPGFYVSVVTFHPEMIPYDLAIRIAASRSGVPFSVSVEALAMSVAFFTLLQASVMISQNIGSAVSIVGGLVLGQAAISAGYMSPGVIVVVAAASICSLAVPNKDLNTIEWMFQLLCTLMSAVFGLMGVVITLMALLFMLARLTPLGVPYIAPFAGTKQIELSDSVIKLPDNLLKKRPLYLDPKNIRRRP